MPMYETDDIVEQKKRAKRNKANAARRNSAQTERKPYTDSYRGTNPDPYREKTLEEKIQEQTEKSLNW